MMIFAQKGGIYMKMKNFKKLAATLAVVITCQSIPAYTVLADDAAEGNTKNSVMTTSGNDVAGTTTLENNEEVTKPVVESEENVADTTSGNDPGIMLLSFDDCTHDNGVITSNNDGTHHVSCPDCTYEVDEACTYENGTCSVCGADVEYTVSATAYVDTLSEQRGYVPLTGSSYFTIDNPYPTVGDIVTITINPGNYKKVENIMEGNDRGYPINYISSQAEAGTPVEINGNPIIECDWGGWVSLDPVTIKIKIKNTNLKDIKLGAYCSVYPEINFMIYDMSTDVRAAFVNAGTAPRKGYYNNNGDANIRGLYTSTSIEDLMMIGSTPVGYAWRLDSEPDNWHTVYLSENYKSPAKFSFSTEGIDGLYDENGKIKDSITIKPVGAMLHINTVGMVKVSNLSPNIFTNKWDLSDPYSQNMIKTGLYFDDNYATTADNAEGKKIQRFASMFSAKYWHIGTLDGKYSVDGAYYRTCTSIDNELSWSYGSMSGDSVERVPYVQSGDELAVYSPYSKADFAKYGISYEATLISNFSIPGLSTRDSIGTSFNRKMEDTKSEYNSYFAGKYVFPEYNAGDISHNERVNYTPLFTADTYKITTYDVYSHGTYTVKNATPERYCYNGLGNYDPETGEEYSYSMYPTEDRPNHLYEGDDIGFFKSSDDDVLADNEFTYMDTITCTATPNTGWHVKEWVCMQDGENRWVGMFDDETADYSTFTINMTNLGDAEIYPVFEGADPVVPTTEPTTTPEPTATPTVAPTVEPTVAPTEAPKATETPAPEEDDDDEPEPTVEHTATPEPTEPPKVAVIPVTPTKPEDTPEPSAEPTEAPTSAPEKTAEPEIIIVPPTEPVELEDNISKIIPATLAVTGTGAFGFAILFLVMRTKRKFHGIFAENLIPGTKEKGDRTEKSYDYFVPELIQKVNAGSMGVSSYEDVLLGSDVITLFPADSKVTIAADGLSVTFAADEAKLFDYLLKIKGQALVLIDSEEKNIHLTFTYNL